MATRFGRKKLAPDDQRLLMALGHPVRAEALGILNTRVASPAQIARSLGLDVSNVSYHVRRLLEYECIELVETRAARGATEHFYRGVAHKYLDEGFWTKLSGSVRSAISLTALRIAFGAIRDAVFAGTFDRRKDRHLSVVTYDLDGQGWEEISGLYLETLDRTMEIAAESAERLGEGRPRGKGLRATFVQVAFESPPTSRRSDPSA
ncbi:MAG TPA: helix-turn-helix domain-containing protein [Solirubrobacterales bacterium]|nr:helix-turn-helix domain-containing protein [Solirubrobacterales bacterium]